MGGKKNYVKIFLGKFFPGFYFLFLNCTVKNSTRAIYSPGRFEIFFPLIDLSCLHVKIGLFYFQRALITQPSIIKHSTAVMGVATVEYSMVGYWVFRLVW